MLSQYYQDGYPSTEKIDNPDWVSNKKTPDVPKKIRVPIPGQFGTADPKLVQRLKDSKPLNYANFPDMETDDDGNKQTGTCPYDVSGRNWLFAGMEGVP